LIARLGANESGFGPSPAVIAAIAREAPLSWRYGDPENHDLRQALGAHLGLAPECVVVGEGIDGLLGMLARLIVEPGTPVVTSLGAYPTFNFHVAGFGGRLVTVPYRDDREDLDGLRDAVRQRKRGDRLSLQPRQPDGHLASGRLTSWLSQRPCPKPPCWCSTRPMAKPHRKTPFPRSTPSRPCPMCCASAPSRKPTAWPASGWATCSARRNRVAVSPGAQSFRRQPARPGRGLAALEDQAWLQSVIARVAAARDRIADIGRANGFAPIASATNFVTMDCGGDATRAKAILDGLVSRGVFIRMPGVAPLNRCIRISAAPERNSLPSSTSCACPTCWRRSSRHPWKERRPHLDPFRSVAAFAESLSVVVRSFGPRPVPLEAIQCGFGSAVDTASGTASVHGHPFAGGAKGRGEFGLAHAFSQFRAQSCRAVRALDGCNVEPFVRGDKSTSHSRPVAYIRPISQKTSALASPPMLA
jgi:histidinol-phosphate aminotransferase